jgi:hypothetical protein
MLVELDGLVFRTVEGDWSTEYVGEPHGFYDSDRVIYHIKFRRVGRNNTTTSYERRLRLMTYHSQTTFSDYEEKLRMAIEVWLDSMEAGADPAEEVEAAYVYPSTTLQPLVS